MGHVDLVFKFERAGMGVEWQVRLYFYRPQTKIAKVMFLHVSIILSTGGSPGPYPGGGWGVWTRSGGLQAHTQGRGWGSGWGSPACTEAEPPLPADGCCCCGHYASYWNAFLYDLCVPSWYGSNIQISDKNAE